jgi:hypothetical protein
MDSTTASIIVAIIGAGATVAVTLIKTFGVNRRTQRSAESPHERGDPSHQHQRPLKLTEIRIFILWCLAAAFILFVASRDILTGNPRWLGSVFLAMIVVGVVVYRVVKLLDGRRAP